MLGAYDICMTRAKQRPLWHWGLVLIGIPAAGAGLAIELLAQNADYPLLAAAVVPAVGAFAVDFARRRHISAVLVGAVVGLLSVVLAIGFFIAALLVSCSSGTCGID